MMTQRARQGFSEALAGHPFNTLETLQDELDQGRAFLWEGERSDVFVRIDSGVCEVGPAAGDLSEIIERAKPAIEAWARENRCHAIHIQAGRAGWEKALAPFGYEVAAVILRKELV
jgi:hypothetical protein